MHGGYPLGTLTPCVACVIAGARSRLAAPFELDLAQIGMIGCRERLGGVLKHYFRRAA